MPLLAGDAGTEQTIALIRRAVEDSWRDPLVRSTAGRIIAGIDPADAQRQARAIYHWVLRSIQFVRDPVGHETVSSARWTLTQGFGDCDDINAVLLPALLGAVGIHSRLVTVAINPADAASFSHVYMEAALNGRWVPLDAARPGASFGRAPEKYSRKRIWELESAEFQDVSGLGDLIYPDSGDWGRGDGGGGGLANNILRWITPIGQQVTNVITALRATPASLRLPLTAGQTYVPPGGAGAGSTLGIGTGNLLLIGGLVIVGLMVAKGKG